MPRTLQPGSGVRVPISHVSNMATVAETGHVHSPRDLNFRLRCFWPLPDKRASTLRTGPQARWTQNIDGMSKSCKVVTSYPGGTQTAGVDSAIVISL